jgi:thiol-disulfide isomerase/thioredoxin
LPGIDGKTYTDKSFAKADILVLIFTCAHCPTAQAYQERIKKLVSDYKPKNVTLVAINPNHADSVRLDELAYSDLSDSFDELKERAKREKFNFLWLDDGPKQEVSHRYGPVATPHVFIFDQKRVLRFEGRIDDSERDESMATSHDTRAALDALLAGKTPEITTTKVFGCSVKWADKVADYANYKKKWAAEPVELEKADAATLRAIRENKDSGKIRFINVWATWCGPCITEFDELVLALLEQCQQPPSRSVGVRSVHLTLLVEGDSHEHATVAARSDQMLRLRCAASRTTGHAGKKALQNRGTVVRSRWNHPSSQ